MKTIMSTENSKLNKISTTDEPIQGRKEDVSFADRDLCSADFMQSEDGRTRLSSKRLINHNKQVLHE